MEDLIQTKIAPDGSWVNVNLSEMARILQAANPGAEILLAGKASNQENGIIAAEKERKRLKAKVH